LDAGLEVGIVGAAQSMLPIDLLQHFQFVALLV
jgi:hypothetical protein